MVLMSLSIPRGTRDYDPVDSIALHGIMHDVEQTFRSFGFCPLETPSVESLEVLSAKAYGEESRNEIFLLEDGQEGLRYDFTVPMARYIAMNRDLQFPFKRYQIGSVWRMDEPQKMRQREFLQADIDIAGSSEISSEAEVIGATATALRRVGIREYSIFINSRMILDLALGHFGLPKEKHAAAIRLIDKMQKIGRDEVGAGIVRLGIDQRKCDDLLDFMSRPGSNEEKLEAAAAELDGAQEEVKRLEKVFSLLKLYDITGRLEIDLSLARGLDYYTSTIFEFVAFDDGKRLPTIAAGGRYDGLISIYSKREVPAVGSSIGIARIFELLGKKAMRKTYAIVHVSYIKEENLEHAVRAVQRLREAGICADLEVTKRKLSKQLEYTSSMGTAYTMIIGEKEVAMGKIRLRNMIDGSEELLSLDEAIVKLS